MIVIVSLTQLVLCLPLTAALATNPAHYPLCLESINQSWIGDINIITDRGFNKSRFMDTLVKGDQSTIDSPFKPNRIISPILN